MSTHALDNSDANTGLASADADPTKVASGQPPLPPPEHAVIHALVQTQHSPYPPHPGNHLPFLTVEDAANQSALPQASDNDVQSTSFLAHPQPAAKGRRAKQPDEEGKPKMKRIFQACSKCRERKAKCDGMRPTCSSCITRGLQCEYASERKMRGPSKKRLREDGTAPPPKRRKPQNAEPGQNPDGNQVQDPYGMQDPSVPPGYVDYEDPNQFGFQAPYPGQPYPPGPDGQHLGYPGMHPPHDGPAGPIDMNGAAYPGQPQYDPAVYGHPPAYPPQYQAYAYQPDGPVAFQHPPVTAARPSGQERSPEASTSQPPPTAAVNNHFLSREEFAVIMDRYLNSLSRKNREKALLTQAVYNDVLTLLKAGKAAEEFPDGTSTDADGNPVPPAEQHLDIDPSLDTPQFRFWVRKMFALQQMNDVEVVAHNGKPVAVQEQLYDILIHCHAQTNHGGRDKTAHMVNEHYSWIPKVFIETFVKSCPGCPRRNKKVEAIESAERAASNSPHVVQVDPPIPEDSVTTQQTEVTSMEAPASGDIYQQTGMNAEGEPPGHPAVQVKPERKGKSRAKAT